MPQHPAYEKIKPDLPEQPGIYKFLNKEGTVIYVGKAKNLKRRVASYFTKKHERGKTRILVSKIHEVQLTIVETEQDALLLENAMIKKLQPRYNIQLKDDKTYPYICIKKERFPRVFMTRQVIKDGSTYLGPFTSVYQVKTILEALKQIFPLRTCNLKLSEKNIKEKRFKVCLEYHIGNCLGPCEALQTEEDYNKNIAQLKSILKGNCTTVLQFLKEKMNEHSEKFEFEKAQEYKNKIKVLQNYQSKSTIVNININNVDVFAISSAKNHAFVSYFKVINGTIIQAKILELTKNLEETEEELLAFAMIELRQQVDSNSEEIILPFELDFPNKKIKLTVPLIGEKRKLLKLAQKNADYYKKQKEVKASLHKTAQERNFEILKQMQQDFRLKELPRHIECFDNSNFQGSNPVASMVLFRDGKPSNKEYRHFKIKTVEGPNDFASMTEVVHRRYKRLLEEEQPLPQLIIVDGGKGQLNAGLKALEELNLKGKVAIIGIAKRLEEIYVPDDPLPLYIDKRSPTLKLTQQLRNEAHRFAISFHRKLRSKNQLKSEFEKVPGIGPTTVQKLLVHFKSPQKIKSANLQELMEVIDKKKAEAIINYFSPSD